MTRYIPVFCAIIESEKANTENESMVSLENQELPSGYLENSFRYINTKQTSDGRYVSFAKIFIGGDFGHTEKEARMKVAKHIVALEKSRAIVKKSAKIVSIKAFSDTESLSTIATYFDENDYDTFYSDYYNTSILEDILYYAVIMSLMNDNDYYSYEPSFDNYDNGCGYYTDENGQAIEDCNVQPQDEVQSNDIPEEITSNTDSTDSSSYDTSSDDNSSYDSDDSGSSDSGGSSD